MIGTWRACSCRRAAPTNTLIDDDLHDDATNDIDEAGPIAPVLPDDDRTNELRAAVWDDPLSDDARLVYADYLQDRGDPRGELVGLQVARARSGDRVSDRERALLRRIATDCAKPLAPYLASDFQLARGFVAKCTVNDTPMPDAITCSPAWRTVDDLSTTSYDLLVSPHVRAPRVGVGGRQLADLAAHARRLPFETVVGIAPLGRSQRGVWLEEAAWDQVMRIGALEDLRVLSVSPESGYGPRLIAAVLRSVLGRQLRQLDAYVDGNTPEATRWRDAFDQTRVPLLTFRFVPVAPARGRPGGPEILVALRRTPRLPQIIVQVEHTLTADHVTIAMRFIAQLSRGVQYAELHDFTVDPGRIPGRHPTLFERMNAMFPQVVVQPPSARPLAP